MPPEGLTAPAATRYNYLYRVPTNLPMLRCLPRHLGTWESVGLERNDVTFLAFGEDVGWSRFGVSGSSPQVGGTMVFCLERLLK